MVSNPNGQTPHGIPYPGSDDVHPRTPNAIKAVAEAVDTLLYHVGDGIVLRLWEGAVQLDGSANGTLSPAAMGLSRMDGAIVQLGWLGSGADGGSVRAGFCTGADGTRFNAVSANEYLGGNPNQNNFRDQLVHVFVAAWGAAAAAGAGRMDR